MTMFQVQTVTTNIPICRQQVLEDLLTRKRHGEVYKVWSTPGHLCVSFEQGAKLYTFDILPTSQPQMQSHQGFLDLMSISPPLVDILFTKRNGKLNAFLVQENGHIQVWVYSMEYYIWTVAGDLELCNATGARVMSVLLHESHNTIYWCERRGSGSIPVKDCSYCICKRTLPPGTESVSSSSIGSVMAMLNKCPQCELTALKESLVIWPREPTPPGLFFKWFHNSSTMEIHMLHKGLVLIEDNIPTGLDFRNIANQLIGLWTDLKVLSSNPSVVSRFVHPNSRQMYILMDNGQLDVISDLPDVEYNVCKFCNTDGAKDSQWLMYRCAVLAVNKNTIRVFSLSSGNIIQTLDISDVSGSEIKTWCSRTGVHTVGLYSEKGVFKIQMMNTSKWEKTEDTAEIMHTFGKRHLAVQTLLEGAQEYYKMRSIHGSELEKDLLLNTNVFQSPALLVALLQQNKDQQPTPEISAHMQHLLQKYGPENFKLMQTKLNDLIGPLLSDFWLLEERANTLMDDQEGALQQQKITIKETVLHLLRTDSCTSIGSKRTQIEIIAEAFPDEVLEVLMEYLDLETDAVSTETQIAKWGSILASESSLTSSGSTYPLFEIICRLLFRQRPDQLLKFVKISQAVYERAVGTSAFARQKEEYQFYERALECIGEPEKSTKKEMAAKTQASLVLNSGRAHCQVDALQLLLKHHLWIPAIKIVGQLADNSDLHVEVFHLLMSTLIKEGVFSQYCSQVMEFVPERIGIIEILKFFEQYQPKRPLDSDAAGIFCSLSTDVSVGALRPYLIQLLTEDSLDSKEDK